MSCRAFLPTPVPEATVRAILDGAKQSPSGGNLQPWRVYALAGEPLKEFIALVRSKLPTHPRGDGSEYDIYPTGLWEPYRSRRFKCGEDMYATIGVTRDDKPAREEVGKRAISSRYNLPQVLKSELGDNAGVLGAARLVFDLRK